MPKRISTPNEINLYNALSTRNVEAKLQYWDGYKHVDLAIPSAKIYIEIDDINHFTDPKKILSDFNREHYSDRDGFNTFFVTNQILENKNLLEKVADALEAVVKMRNS